MVFNSLSTPAATVTHPVLMHPVSTIRFPHQLLHQWRIPKVLRVQGWGLLSQFPPFRYFPKFSSLSKHTLTVEYRVYIRQVSPQLSCGETCQILMWFKESNMYFCEIENFAYGEINEWSFSNPHPWPVVRGIGCHIHHWSSWGPQHRRCYTIVQQEYRTIVHADILP